MTELSELAPVERKPFEKGEQPVRVEGYPGTWVVIAAQEGETVELGTIPVGGGMLLVNASKVHRGHKEWVDDD